MDQPTLSENYSVCLREDGSLREIRRNGPIITYKAVGYETGKPVALQTIPLAGIDGEARARFEERAAAVQKLDHVNIARVLDAGVEDDHILYVSEYLQGETTEAWVVAHGALAADAVLRIAMQVVSALGAAAFHGLSHRSVQPSNLMIVPGIAPDGGWPLIKLVNFGMAGLKLYSEAQEPAELAPRIAPQFASPEQLKDGKVDFRSEMFSLGATMCFLLTGAVPLAARRSGPGVPDRTLPPGAPVPRIVRAVLSRMLRSDPAERPRDPVAFQEELRLCLQKVERRTAFTRRFGPPVTIAAEPVRRRKRRVAPAVLALAAAFLALAAVAAFFLPTKLRAFVYRNRSLESIGVPVGVPENVADNSASAAAQSGRPSPPEASSADSPAARIASNERSASRTAPTAADDGDQGSAPALAQEAPQQPDMPDHVRDTGGYSGTTAQESPPEVAAQPPPPAIAQPSPAVVAQGSPMTGQAAATGGLAASQSGAAVSGSLASNAAGSQHPPAAERPESLQRNEEQSAEPTPAVPADSLQQQKIGAPGTASAPDISRDSGDSGARRAGAKAARSSKSRLARAGGGSRRTRSAGGPSDRSLPPLQVGSQRAQFVGTTQNGNWILQLPSGDSVVTPPVPNTEEAPVISHRRVRRVHVEPEPPPANQQPPVVVLPPDT